VTGSLYVPIRSRYCDKLDAAVRSPASGEFRRLVRLLLDLDRRLPLTLSTLPPMLPRFNRALPEVKKQALRGANVKKMLSLATLLAVLVAGPAIAADPVLGTWELNVAKSKFAGTPLTAGTRVYSETKGLYTLDQKVTGADGKEMSSRTTYRDGREEKQPAGGVSDATLAKKIDVHTWNFELKKDGKVVGHVHRVVSTDGKTLTVHNSGAKLTGAEGDETLVFDKH